MAHSNQWNGQEVKQRCDQLKTEWEELEELCEKRSGELNKAVTREQVIVLQTAFTFFIMQATHFKVFTFVVRFCSTALSWRPFCQKL